MNLPHPRLLLAVVFSTSLSLVVGCQSPSFLTGNKGPQPSPSVQQASASSADSAGLPQPTNGLGSKSANSAASADEHLRLGEEALERGSYSEAQLHFEQVVNQHPDHAKAHHRLGVVADKLSQFAGAEQHYRTALEYDPRNAAILSDLGYSYWMQGRYPESERYLLEARKFDPSYHTAVANLGLLYGTTGRQQEAVAMFRQIGDEAQVGNIMQQIASGTFAPMRQMAGNQQRQPNAVSLQGNAFPIEQAAFAQQRQDGIETIQTSVAAAQPVNPADMNDATRAFAEQLRQARERLDLQEQELAQQRQRAGLESSRSIRSPQSPTNPFGQSATQAMPQRPQPPAWAMQNGQAPQNAVGRPTPQYAGVTPFPNQRPQQSPQAGYVPDHALSDMMANIDRRARPPVNNTAIVIERSDASTPTNQSPYAQTPFSQDRTQQTTQIFTGPASQPRQPQRPSRPTDLSAIQQNGPAQNASAWGQQAVPGATLPQNSLSQTPRTQTPQVSAVGQSAWAQQFGRSLGQPASQTMSPQQGTQQGIPPAQAYGQPSRQPIQQLQGQLDPRTQQPVEHAYHTQPPGQGSNINLTGQTGQPNNALVPPTPSSLSPQSQQPVGGPSYDQARREAALLGLGAGPGQVFPYIQQTQRLMPGTDSRINGAQYPAPVRHMPSGLTPPNLNPAMHATQPTNIAPSQSYNGQSSPNVHAHLSGPSRYGAASSAQFSQQQLNAQPQANAQHQQTGYHTHGPALGQSDPYQELRASQARQLNQQINNGWGQSPQTPGYGVTPPSATAQYGSATMYVPRSSATPSNATQSPTYGLPNNQRADASPLPNSTTPQGVVIPEPYRPTQQTGRQTGTTWSLPSVQSQPAGRQQARPPTYDSPLIVPGRR